MKRKILIIILFLTLSIKSQIYKENVEIYCKKIDQNKWQMSAEERIKQREALWPLMSGSLGSIVAFLNKGEVMGLLTGVLLHIIFIIIIILAALVSFIVFSFFCCYCKKSPKKNKKRARTYFIISLFTGILYIVCFLIFIIMFSNVKNGTDELNCALSNSAEELLDGANSIYYEFLGFNILVSLLTDLESEAENLKSVTDNFDAMFNLNLVDQGTAPISALNEFYNSYKEKTILDGDGKPNKPIIINDLEKTKEKIETQFEIWKNIAEKVSESSKKGKTLSTNDAIKKFKDDLNVVIKETIEYKNELQGPLDNLSKTVGQITEYFPLIFTLGVVLGVLNFILFIFTIVILFFQCKKLRCYKCNCCFKFSLFLLGIVSLLFSGISLYVMVITSSMGTVCNEIPAILNSEDPAKHIANIGVGMNEQLDKLANNCLKNATETSGDFKDLFKEDLDFESTQVLLDGITIFKNFDANLTLAPVDSEIITNTTKVWKNYEIGYFVNFENVNTTLDTLNTQLKQCDVQMVFNNLNCTIDKSKGVCYIIPEVVIPYSAPECADDTTKSNELFVKLRDYNLGSQDTTSKMITNLSGEEENTPNFKYKQLKNSLNLAMIEQRVIQPKLFNTLNNASKLTFGFTAAANCKIFRKELLNVEAGICFNSVNNSFLSYVFVLFMNIFLILYNWMIYCTLRNIVEERPFNKLNDSVELGDDDSDSDD